MSNSEHSANGGDRFEATVRQAWLGERQAHGLFRAHNTIVKLMPLFVVFAALAVIAASAFFEKPDWNAHGHALLFQGLALILGVYYLTVNPSRGFVNWMFGFSLGSTVVALLSSAAGLIPYERMLAVSTVRIPGVLSPNLMTIAMFGLTMLAILKVRSAYGLRDITWLIERVPSDNLRKKVGYLAFACGYSLMETPRLLRDADRSLRARGLNRPKTRHLAVAMDRFVDDAGPWVLFLFRSFKEMAALVEFLVISRIRLRHPDRLARVAPRLGSADFAMIGIFVCGVPIPWLVVALQSIQ